jgi:hypothetical protein
MLNTMWPAEDGVKVECPGSPVQLVPNEEFHRLSPPDSQAQYYYPDHEDCTGTSLVTLATLPPFQSLPPSASPARSYFVSAPETLQALHASPDSSARTSLASPSPPRDYNLGRIQRKRSNSEDSSGSATSTHIHRSAFVIHSRFKSFALTHLWKI